MRTLINVVLEAIELLPCLVFELACFLIAAIAIIAAGA